MLGQERAGAKLNKADLYRRLSPEVGRSVKSIEWKLRNVSAVLEKLGISWIPGLVPAHNHQDALVEAVEVQLGLHPEVGSRFGEAALHVGGTAGPCGSTGVPQIGFGGSLRGTAPADREIRSGGEGRVQPTPRTSRRADGGRVRTKQAPPSRSRRLGGDVRWVSDQDGDHFGYDIQSFDLDGRHQLLEVKTTNGHARTRFWLSRNQCEVAARNPETYRVRRVYHFRNGAQMFDITPPLDAGLWLTPDKYVAVPR